MGSDMNKFAFPLAHLLSAPTHHCILIDRQRFVGHHKVGVEPDDFSESLALGTCAVRVVEIEHEFRWFAESDAVGVKTLREVVTVESRLAPYEEAHLIVTLKKRGFHRVGETACLVAGCFYGNAVDKKVVAVGCSRSIGSKKVFDHDKFTILDHSRVSLLEVYLELLAECALFGQRHRRDYRYACAFRIRLCGSNHIFRGMLLYLHSRHRGIGLADSPEQQTHIVVNLGRSADG